MNYAPEPEQPTYEEDNTDEVIEVSEATRKLAILALICSIEDDYASGSSYPNIPFGD